MADPVQQPDISSAPLPDSEPSQPKAQAPVVKQTQAKPQAAPSTQGGKLRLEPLNVNLGRTGIPSESLHHATRGAHISAKAPKPAPGAKPAAPAAKPAPGVPGAKPAAPAAKGVPAAPGAKPAAPVAPAAKPAPAVPGAKPPAPAAKGVPAAPGAKPAAPVAPAAKPAPVAKSKEFHASTKRHYFIIENRCVGCGLCLDKCPPKVKAIGYKFYGDVQEGGFRCYIDQSACISCSACFNSDECPAGALIEILPHGEVLDYKFTPPERLDFDLRFLHRFHREST
ncbi:MAG: 4Fe-4S dicluster domain-containing protein [Chlorobiaceae bacterium]